MYYCPDDDLMKSGFAGEHADSSQRLMYTCA
jgi:hypothetical protein